MVHKFYIYVYLIISVFLIIGCTSENISTNTEKTTQTYVKEQTQQQTIQQEEKQKPKETIYTMNQNVKVDYLTYKVTKAETFTEMGTSMFNKETEGKFVKVYLKIINNAKETKEIFTPRFKIEDNQKRRYDRLSNDMMYIADYLEFGKQLQPGLATSGAIVFEMPKDAEDLKFIITGDWLSDTEVKITLSKITDIGKDTTQKEEVNEIMDETVKEGEEMVQELMNKCSTPFKCSSSCPDMMDVGQKDCPSGQLCCMET
jgi:hypothetical protein